MGINLHWEHRSFKEQGIDREPTIHIGAITNALERKGIQTERGNINREIVKHNMMLEQAKEMLDIANAKNFLERNNITTFAQLEKYKTDKGKEFDSREQIFIPKWQRLEQLKELAKAYADYEPYKAVHDMSKSLSGLKKLKYDKEHEHDLAFAEVISYNKANLERMEQNESQQQNRQQTVSKTVGRTKRREEELLP